MQADVPSQILTLDWHQHGGPHDLVNPETIARTLRFRALGNACCEQGIRSLLFAHHADDQAETTLMRLANKYLGRGLAGMQPQAHIPECEAMYGVDDSGMPREFASSGSAMLVESGGVDVLRPLLSYTKDRLVATCEQARTKWVEDQTNKDPSLTLRNTVRQLHEGNRLPKALQRPSLCAIAGRTRQRMVRHEAEARRIFQSLDIDLNPRSGSAICKISDNVVGKINELPGRDHIKVLLLRMLLLLVAPTRQMDLATLEAASRNFLNQSPGSTSTIAFAGAAMAPLKTSSEDSTVYELRRTPPIKAAKKPWPEVKFSLPPSQHDSEYAWSEWQLWDERYWIRIGALKSFSTNTEVIVRFPTAKDLTQLYDELRDDERRTKDLREHLAQVKGHLRATLPVIAQAPIHEDFADPTKTGILALPSISWSRDGWISRADLQKTTTTPPLCYEIRYKHVDDIFTKPIGSERAV